MRRRMDLQVDQHVQVQILCPTNQEAQGLKKREAYLKTEVRATRIEILSITEKGTLKPELEEIWTIDRKTYKMGMRATKGKG